MTNKRKIAGMALLTLLGLIVAACAGSTGSEPVDQGAQSSSEVNKMFVGPLLVDCEGEGPQKCMLVKENPEDDYTLFYDQIEGFNYEAGFEYELEVEVEQVADPPAGGSSLKWSLIRILNKQPVAIAPEGELKTIFVDPELVDCVGVAPEM